MSEFIDINRLDYVNPEYIYLPEEFSKFEEMHGNYRDKAVKFLIKTILKGRHPVIIRPHLWFSGSISAICGNGTSRKSYRRSLKKSNPESKPFCPASGIVCGF